MAKQQETPKKTGEKETKKKKVQAEAKAEGAEAVSPPPAAASAAAPKKSMKKGKLLPKNKHRLPRRQKKAQRKAATRL